MVTSNDPHWIIRSRQGDRDAYGLLVRQHQRAVYNVCYRLLGERQAAEDMTQETFIRAYQRLHTFQIGRPFGPWIRRVATNLCYNHLNARRDAAIPLDDERLRLAGPSSQEPEASHLRHAKAERVRQAILSLPAHYRAVIELRHFQDLSYAEIAAVLGIPLSDVKSHLFRARKQLARLLSQDENEIKLPEPTVNDGEAHA